jgi:hypothetical protein
MILNQAERYDDMVKYVEALLGVGSSLNVEERNLMVQQHSLTPHSPHNAPETFVMTELLYND